MAAGRVMGALMNRRGALQHAGTALVGGLALRSWRPAAAWPAPPAAVAAELSAGTIILLTGAPHVWIVDQQGALRWVGDTRALAGMMVDWSRLETRNLDQLRQLPRRAPLLSAGLVALGSDIFVARWDTWQVAPSLLRVQSPADLALMGIDRTNYGAQVRERGQWEREMGIGVDSLERAELAPFAPLPVLTAPPHDPVDEATSWEAALAAAPALGVGNNRATEFPGRLRLPPRSLPLLDGLQLQGSAADPARGAAPAEYVVILKGPTTQPGGPSVALPLSDSSAIFQGVAGRAEYDRARARPHGCEGGAGYCATYLRLNGDSPGGIEADGTVTPPVHEQFGEMITPPGQPAIVTHAAMGNGEWWEVDWYDAEADVSYSAHFYLDIATRIGAPGLAPTNVGYARLLADLTSTFVAVPASEAE